MRTHDVMRVRITKHALKQYHDRVGSIEWSELQRLCEHDIQERNFSYDAKGWLHLAGVWWVYKTDGYVRIFITCYGKSNILMPDAIAWAARHNDRIILTR